MYYGENCSVFPGTPGLNFEGYLRVLKHQNTKAGGESSGTRMSMEVSNYLENLVYHFLRQLWLVLGVKLMEINSNWFSR